MKTCFKCGNTLPLSEFYVHKAMSDGHLGKCKACTKKDTAERVALKYSTDPEWVLMERARQRAKQEKARREGVAVKGNRKETIKRYDEKYPKKRIARSAVANAIRDGKLQRKPCSVCGKIWSQAHHEDYSKPLEVIWLCNKHHHDRHVKIRDREAIAHLTQ
jgi:DNA repair exonuclease SbcCD ATPase subunit